MATMFRTVAPSLPECASTSCLAGRMTTRANNRQRGDARYQQKAQPLSISSHRFQIDNYRRA